MLNTQNSVGDSTLCALSDMSHCTSMRAEEKPCARKPIAYIRKFIYRRYRYHR